MALRGSAHYSPSESGGSGSHAINVNGPRSSSSPPIVIGGGVAGIAAAVALALAGERPILVESRPYLGGRVRSFTHATTGDEIDNGQHLLMGCYESTLALLDILGTRSLVDIQPSLHVEFRDTERSRPSLIAPSSSPPPLDLIIGMMRLNDLSLGERLALARVAIDARIGGTRPEETVRHYLTRLDQSPAAQRRLWDPMVIATLNTAPELASATLFRTVMRRAFLGGGISSRLVLPRTGLSRLLEPASDFIEQRGGHVLLGNPLVALERNGERMLLGFKDGSILESERVISALPSHALRGMLERGGLQTAITAPIEQIAYSPIVSLYLWFDVDPPALPPFAALLGTSIQWMFNRRRISGSVNAEYPGLLSCTISAATAEAAVDSEQIIETAERELRRAFPELREARLLAAQVIKEKQATFAATPEAESIRPTATTSIPGFFLAGDWTCTGLPATIEGAAWSGFEAADLLLSSRTHTLPLKGPYGAVGSHQG